MRAIGYTRVSTEEQAEGGVSLAAQDRAIRAYCVAQGWSNPEVFVDAGLSGGSMVGREALARALITPADRLVIWRLDRLSRSLRDLLDIAATLAARGVGLVSVTDNVDTGSASGRLTFHLLGTIAEFERESISERTRMGMRELAAQGRTPGPPPLGYRRVAGQLVEDPDRAPLVREMFAVYAEGHTSTRQLTGWLRSHGVRRLHQTIVYALSNRTYLGEVQGRPGSHPPLIDPDLFERAQLVRMKRGLRAPSGKPWGRQPYPLTGILRCGHCGSPMVGWSGGRPKVRYYRCRTAVRQGYTACAQRGTQAETLESVALMFLMLRVNGPGRQQAMDQAAQLLRRRTGPDPAVIKRKLDRWRRLYADLGEISEAEYLAEVGPLKEELARIALPPAVDPAVLKDYIRQIPTLYANAGPAMQREIFQRTITSATIKGEEIVEIQLVPELQRAVVVAS